MPLKPIPFHQTFNRPPRRFGKTWRQKNGKHWKSGAPAANAAGFTLACPLARCSVRSDEASTNWLITRCCAKSTEYK